MALTFVNIKTPVSIDVCEIVSKRIALLDRFADVQCPPISTSVSYDIDSFDRPSNMEDLRTVAIL